MNCESYGEDEEDSIYYRLLRSDSGRIHIVTMQYFDESDYDQSRFVSDQQHDSRRSAEDELNRMIVLVLEHMSAPPD